MLLLAVLAVGQAGRCRLVDDAEHLEARDGPRVLRRLPLAVVKIVLYCAVRRQGKGIGNVYTGKKRIIT